ncbi:MATE family efflux transporter [Treponema parvum]|nr:MATE family efflux transporter [Treponema parvum]
MQRSNEDEIRRIKHKKMTQTPVPKLVLKMAVPTIISMMVSSIYNMADTFFMGRISASATAAVGIIFSLMAIIQGAAFFFGHGSGNYISRRLGAKDPENASKMAADGVYLGMVFGVVICVVGLCLLKPLALFFGATQTVLPYAMDYMGIILIGSPFIISGFILNNQLRFQGSAFFAMLGIASGAVLNIVLDPIFIFVFNLGIRGAALATIISQFISFCILVLGTVKKSSVSISVKYFSLSKEKIFAMFQGGTPSLARNILASVSMIVLNRAVSVYGDEALAAMSIVQRFSFMMLAVVLGLGQGFQPVCGFNYGASLYSRVRQAFLFCVGVGTAFYGVVLITGFTAADLIVGVFCNNDPGVLQLGVKIMHIYWSTCLLIPFVVISSMLLENINHYKSATFAAMSRQGLFMIPCLMIFPRLFGFTGIIVCQPISDILCFAAILFLVAPVLKKFKET